MSDNEEYYDDFDGDIQPSHMNKDSNYDHAQGSKKDNNNKNVNKNHDRNHQYDNNQNINEDDYDDENNGEGEDGEDEDYGDDNNNNADISNIDQKDYSSKNSHMKNVSDTPTQNKNNDKVNKSKQGTTNESYYEKIKALVESDCNMKKEKEIEIENQLLRKHLRELNDNLTKILAKQDLTTLPKKKEIPPKNQSDKYKLVSQDILNNEKLLLIQEEEYQKLSSKVEKARDSNYLIEIKEKYEKVKAQIEEAKKTNKKLELAEEKSGKNLQLIDCEEGNLDMMADINSKGRELTILKRKIEKITGENEQNEQNKQELMEKFENITEKHNKLVTIAGHYKIDQPNGLLIKYEELSKKVAKLEEETTLMSKKNAKFLACNVGRALDDLKIVNQRDREILIRLDEMVKQQAESIKSLLNRESLRSDRSMRDMISKMKVSIEDGKEIERRPQSGGSVNLDDVGKNQLLNMDLNNRGRKNDRPPLPSGKMNNNGNVNGGNRLSLDKRDIISNSNSNNTTNANKSNKKEPFFINKKGDLMDKNNSIEHDDIQKTIESDNQTIDKPLTISSRVNKNENFNNDNDYKIRDFDDEKKIKDKGKEKEKEKEKEGGKGKEKIDDIEFLQDNDNDKKNEITDSKPFRIKKLTKSFDLDKNNNIIKDDNMMNIIGNTNMTTSNSTINNNQLYLEPKLEKENLAKNGNEDIRNLKKDKIDYSKGKNLKLIEEEHSKPDNEILKEANSNTSINQGLKLPTSNDQIIYKKVDKFDLKLPENDNTQLKEQQSSTKNNNNNNNNNDKMTNQNDMFSKPNESIQNVEDSLKKEELPIDPVGNSRFNNRRKLKKEEDSYGAVNLITSSKDNNKTPGLVNQNSGLNSEISNNGPSEKKEAYDPFSKFDNLNPLDVVKKDKKLNLNLNNNQGKDKKNDDLKLDLDMNKDKNMGKKADKQKIDDISESDSNKVYAFNDKKNINVEDSLKLNNNNNNKQDDLNKVKPFENKDLVLNTNDDSKKRPSNGLKMNKKDSNDKAKENLEKVRIIVYSMGRSANFYHLFVSFSIVSSLLIANSNSSSYEIGIHIT